jgi:hypothetical protein
VVIGGDVVTLHFDNPLGGPDKAILDAIVAAHTGEGPLRDGGSGAVPVEANRAPTVNDDVRLGFEPGAVWCDNSVTPCATYVAGNTAAGAAEWSRVPTLTGGGKGGASVINIILADLESGEGAGVRIGETAFQVLNHYIWMGTNEHGTPTAIKIVARAEGGAGRPIDVRIVDATNGGLVIASVQTESTTFIIIDMGTVSNLSAGEALWEIQGKRTSGGGVRDGRLSTVQIRF